MSKFRLQTRIITFLLLFLACFSIPSYSFPNTTDATSEQENTSNADTVVKEEQIATPLESYSYWSELSKVVIILGLILATLLVAAYLAKKFLHRRMHYINNSSKIRVLERRSLSPKVNLYLIEVLGQGIVVGETPNGLHRLGEISQEKIISHEHGKNSFEQHLRK
ncbi:MAG: FliO/MopB family protein [Chlamydiota bacterium]